MGFDRGMTITYSGDGYPGGRPPVPGPSQGRHVSLYRKFRVWLALLSAMPLFAAAQATAQEIPKIFGDTEIEQTIRTFCTPIWIAAGLNPNDIHLVLVDNHELNAFVAGGQNIFLYRGFLEATDTPDEVIGVIAHETGHIAGGHLARSDEGMENASYTMLLATILAGAAAVGAHDSPDAIPGALAIGQDMGIRNYLAFSRTQEASADEAALTFLQRAHMSPEGLLDFMKKIQVEEGLPLQGDAKFLIDHPPTPDRVEAIALGVGRSPYAKSKLPPEWIEMHARMKAKLIGYFEPEFALRKYSRADTSVAARYARSIALFKLGQLQPALQLIDGLIAQEPKNPYFEEMKGQMLFENGKVADAIDPLKKAAAMAPKGTDEIHTLYAQVLLERNDPALIPTAIDELNIANRAESRNPDIHRFLAIAYGRQGNEPVAKVELAEQALLEGRTKAGREFALAAMRLLPTGSREWLHAQDLVASSQSAKRRSSDDDSPGLHMSIGPAGQPGDNRFGPSRLDIPERP